MTTAVVERPSALERARDSARRFLPAALLFVGGLASWEIIHRLFRIEGFLLPRPSDIAATFAAEAGTVIPAGWFTFQEALMGFFIGGTAAVLVALLTARWTPIQAGLLPFAVAVNATPIIALAPIMNQWFSVTSIWSKGAIVAVIVFFPVMINTTRGLTEVDERSVELMRSYGATKGTILRKVRIPHALPFVFSAMKVGTTLSVIAAIVSEYFGGSRRALGVYITQQAALFHLAEAWAAIVVASAMGISFYLAVVLLERVVMPWHASVRGEDLG
ncbi:MAG: ABC transporter permease [Acidimicrobiia bacterium]|nr:ABC transporter permease [Acidimicrobiia bacterium]